MTNIKEIYESPEIEVVSFTSEDVITTSYGKVSDIVWGDNESDGFYW